jgi:FkbM family methyltransferase
MNRITEYLLLNYRTLRYRFRYDKGGIAFIRERVKPGDTVLDIGAHKGGYLYALLQNTGKSGKVYAFEPQSVLYQYLAGLKRLFGWANVTIEHLALSDTNSKVTLFVPANKTGKNSSPGATVVRTPNTEGYAAREEVYADTLDAYCARHALQPSFLKIDVEGNELRIFRGGRDTLRKYQPAILVEIEARHAGLENALETFRMLKDMGYTGCFLHDRDRVPLEQFRFDIHQNPANRKSYCNNFIFVAESAAG